MTKELIIGFLLSILLTLTFFIINRRRSKKDYNQNQINRAIDKCMKVVRFQMDTITTKYNIEEYKEILNYNITEILSQSSFLNSHGFNEEGRMVLDVWNEIKKDIYKCNSLGEIENNLNTDKYQRDLRKVRPKK